jgi:hypothetical protein
LASHEELQAAVLGIPGVVGAEIALTPAGAPSVRVWTDDTRDPDDLRAEVKALVARARRMADASGADRVTVRPVAADAGPSGATRSGQRRAHDSSLFTGGDESGGAPLVSIDLTTQPTLEMIAIEESAAGVTVRAVDTAGSVAEAKVIGGAAAINPAIVAAVAELLGLAPPPRLVTVELRDTEAASVMVVTLEMVDTTIAAGAAVVQGGMPFTLGKAAWAAIRSVRQ